MLNCYIELWATTWVIWGYGPPKKNYGIEHIAPASIGVFPMDFPFELPEHDPKSTLGKPTEYRREVRVGWRIRTSSNHDCGWHLAKSETAARKAAIMWVKAQKPALHSALNDIRIREE